MTDIVRPLLRNHAALFGIAVILAMILAALFAPQLAPYPPDEQFFDGRRDSGAVGDGPERCYGRLALAGE